MSVYNFGSLNIDSFYGVEHIAKSGETITSNNFTKYPGGKGFNQSIALARAGVMVNHIGCIGEDGTFLIDILKKEKINTKDIQIVDKATGQAIIQSANNGENSILLFKGANHCLEKTYIDEVFKEIKENDLVLIQNEISNIKYIVEKAYDNNIPVAFNISPITKEIFEIDLNKIKYLFLNEIEGLAITSKLDAIAIGYSFVKKYPNLHIILTLGELGAIYFHHDLVISEPAITTEVVDTTGAGDTFTGYFLSEILKDSTVNRALKIACIASSITIKSQGAANSIPFRSEVLKLLEEIK